MITPLTNATLKKCYSIMPYSLWAFQLQELTGYLLPSYVAIACGPLTCSDHLFKISLLAIHLLASERSERDTYRGKNEKIGDVCLFIGERA